MNNDARAIRLHELNLMTRDAVWETREGRVIPVQEMTSVHINNALRLMRENLLLADDDESGDLWLEEIEDKIILLESELERRELSVPSPLTKLFGS